MKLLRRATPLAVAFEGALGVLGLALAWLFSVPIVDRLRWTAATTWRAPIALAPMLALLVVAVRVKSGPLAKLRRQVQALARMAFGDATWWELAAVAIAAGVGEELLFRGALQPLGERWFGPVAGLVAVSVLFGAVHAASTTYFALAALVGLYLGWLAQRYDDLVTPIFVHAAYDWAALVALLRAPRNTDSLLTQSESLSESASQSDGAAPATDRRADAGDDRSHGEH